jgi:hypothetical protein
MQFLKDSLWFIVFLAFLIASIGLFLDVAVG